MERGLNRGAGEVDGLSYYPIHDYKNVDLDAWSEQWFGDLSRLNQADAKYQHIERVVAVQLGLHPAIREIDASDLKFVMELLSLTDGQSNPYDANSESELERFRYDQWRQLRRLGQMFGRQVVRSTLEDAERYAAFRIEQEHSGTDYLTGAMNRRGFARSLRDQYGITDDPVRRGELDEPLPPVRIAHVYCDVNRFGWINNVLGHHVGDAAIVETAWEVRDMFRGSDIIYRHGGDEFGVALDGLSDLEIDMIVKRLINLQLRKLMSDQYRQALDSIERRVLAVKQTGEPLRTEARQINLSDADVAMGWRPYHVLYINGVAVNELRNILTLAIGAKSAFVSSLNDIERLRRIAEEAMGGAKRVFHAIMNGTLQVNPEDDNDD